MRLLFSAAINRFGPPCSHVAVQSPRCCLPVAFLASLAPCCSPVACLSLPCRLPVASLLLSCCCPVAPLLLPCRCPTALLSLSCRFLSPPVISCQHATFCLTPSCRSPVAFLSFIPVALLSLFPVTSLVPSCCLPAVFLSLPCCLVFASVSLPCCPTWYPVALLSLACRLPVACLSPSCCLPVASLSPPGRPVCYLSLPCCILVASGLPNKCKTLVFIFFTYVHLYKKPCTILSHLLSSTSLSLSCRTPVGFLLPSCRKKAPCRSPAALLSLSCRSPVAFSCRLRVASLLPLALSPSCCLAFAFLSLILSLCLVSCCFPVAALSLPCCPPVAAPLLPSCRLPFASRRFPAASLPLSCCCSCYHPVAFLSPPCRLPVAPCRISLLPASRGPNLM